MNTIGHKGGANQARSIEWWNGLTLSEQQRRAKIAALRAGIDRRSMCTCGHTLMCHEPIDQACWHLNEPPWTEPFCQCDGFRQRKG
jgi:hypothetical protein